MCRAVCRCRGGSGCGGCTGCLSEGRRIGGIGEIEAGNRWDDDAGTDRIGCPRERWGDGDDGVRDLADSGVDEGHDRRRNGRCRGGSQNVADHGNRRDDGVDEVGDGLNDLGYGSLGHCLDDRHNHLLDDRLNHGLNDLGHRLRNDGRDALDNGNNGLDNRIDDLADRLSDLGDDASDAVEEPAVGVGRRSRKENSTDDEPRADESAEQKKPQAIDGSVLFDGIHVNHPQSG